MTLCVILGYVIVSFWDRDTEAVWNRRFVKRFGPEVSRAAYKKMLLIHAAGTLNDLRVPPGNHLEKLKGDRAGQHSIKVNDQWRLCFKWANDGADRVELTDYH
jgi:proteic killer suppression protein